MPRVKTWIRKFVVWSSVSFIAALYRQVYALLILAAVREFRRRKGIEAVYLTRGCVKREILPGISDIDLIVIVSGSGEGRAEVERSFDRLERLSGGLIPSHPSFAVTPEVLLYRWTSVPYWRYRLQEGKSNWRLLLGRDVRGMLPEMSEMERKASCAAELNYWWVQFVRFVMQGGVYTDDAVMRNSICYKAVAEVSNALWAMRTGEYCWSRAEALRREDSELAGRLVKLERQRFLGRDRALEEEAYLFLAQSLRGVWERFEEEPCLESDPEMAQSVDLEGARDELVERRLRTDHLGDRWKGLRVVRSAYWPVEDRLMVVDAGRAALPSLDELDDLLRLMEGNLRQREHLFLKAGGVAFPLTPEMPRDFHRGVLTAATAPDVFLQLSEGRVYWTSHAKWFLTEWQRNGQWANACPLKRRQLGMISAGAARGNVVYPLTEQAIRRLG